MNDRDDCSPGRLKGLSENDPKITKFVVCENNCHRVAEALKGNTHIREMSVVVSSYDEEFDEMTWWTKFCEAAGNVASLRKLEFCVRGSFATRKHFAVFGLLLRHTRQVKDILARGLQDYDGSQPIRDPEYGRVLASHISSHPALESFEVCYFDCSNRDSSLAILLQALVAVPNLKSFTLDTHYQSSRRGETKPQLHTSLEILENLKQLLRKATLRSVEFRELAFEYPQAMGIAGEIGSGDSHLQALSFCGCDLPSIPDFCRDIATSTSLQDLSLACDPLDTNFLRPLSTSKSLKKLHLFGRQAPAPPRFSFFRKNSVMESLHLDFDGPHPTPSSMESMALLFQDVAANEHLQEMKISGHLISIMDRANIFDPLASNKALKKLSFTSKVWGIEEGGQECPSFTFLLENQTLQHLVFHVGYPSAEGGFESMCQALWTNATLEILDLNYCGLQFAHCRLLAAMIVKNLGLREIHMSGNKFTTTKQGLSTLLAALKQNKSIRVLNVATTEPVKGTDDFVKGVLSDTKVRDLVVGEWDGKDAKPLLRIAAKNYRFERMHFRFDRDRIMLCPIRFRREFRILEGTINAIAKLNKAGRCYLVNGSQGPECRAAGVNVLSRVIDDTDCIFYHLRENPVLCNREFSG